MYRMENVSILPYKGMMPTIADGVLLTDGARVIGDVHVGKDSSIWFNAVVRGDVNFVRIGERSNVQDNSMLHVTHEGNPCLVGNDVTIGHSVVLHACTIEDYCLIGMGAIVLDRVVIGKESLVGAGSLVPQGKVFPPRSMIIGSPAKVVRELTDEEVAKLHHSAVHYVNVARNYMVASN